MKSAAVAFVSTGSGLAMAGLVLGAEAAFAVMLWQDGSIGAGTPINGITLGAVIIGLFTVAVVSFRVLVFGIRELWELAKVAVKILDQLKMAAELGSKVEDLEERVGVLEAHADRVDPLVDLAKQIATRSGEKIPKRTGA